MAAKTDPPADPRAEPPADPPADPEKARLDQIEAEQAAQKATLAEHGGMLSKILDKLPGKAPGDPADPPADDSAGKGAPAADIQAAVRREIAEANARTEAEMRAKGDADWRAHVDEALEAVKPEGTPREPQAGVRGKLQRAMFGSDSK